MPQHDLHATAPNHVEEVFRVKLVADNQALMLSVSMRSRERPFRQAHYDDFNVSSHEKHVEKLRYIHRNPVRRGPATARVDAR